MIFFHAKILRDISVVLLCVMLHIKFYNDPSYLAVNAEGQVARFVAKTIRVCRGLLVLMYYTWDRGYCCCHWRGSLFFK